VGFTGDFVSDCPFKLCSDSSNFDSAYFTDYTKFWSVLSGYWIGNLMRIPKMCLKQSFSHFKWVLQAILSFDCPFKLCFWQVKTLTPLFSQIIPNFGMFFQAIE